MMIQTRLDPAVHQAAKKAAERLGITLPEYLRRLLLEDLASRNGGIPEVPPSGGGGGGNIVR